MPKTNKSGCFLLKHPAYTHLTTLWTCSRLDEQCSGQSRQVSQRKKTTTTNNIWTKHLVYNIQYYKRI